MDQLSAAKSLLGKLIGFASVSAAPNRDIIEYIAGVLSDRGARVDILPDASGPTRIILPEGQLRQSSTCTTAMALAGETK